MNLLQKVDLMRLSMLIEEHKLVETSNNLRMKCLSLVRRKKQVHWNDQTLIQRHHP